MKEQSSPRFPAIAEEENVYAGVYYMLIAGMVVSNVLFVIGIVLALIHPQFFPLSPSWVRDQYHVIGILRGLVHGQPTSYFLLGTLLLILTPVARVVVSIRAFWIDGDKKYVGVTCGVLLIMIITAVSGFLGMH